MLTESPTEGSDNGPGGRSSKKLKLLAILTLSVALIALLVVIPVYEKPTATQKRTVSTSLKEILNDPSSWVGKEVSVEARLYVFIHPGMVFQSVAPVDYILVDSNNTQMPISSNGTTMPLSWSMNNTPSVSNGIFHGPYVPVRLVGIVEETTAPDLGFFSSAVSAVYLLALNVTTVNN